MFTCGIFFMVSYTGFIAAERHITVDRHSTFPNILYKKLGVFKSNTRYVFDSVLSGLRLLLKKMLTLKKNLKVKCYYRLCNEIVWWCTEQWGSFPLVSPQVLGLCRSSTRGSGTASLWLLLLLRTSSSSTVNSWRAPTQLQRPAHQVKAEQNENWPRKLRGSFDTKRAKITIHLLLMRT